MQRERQLLRYTGLKQVVPMVVVSVSYMAGQRSHRCVAGSWGFSTCVTPMLVSSQPGWMAFSEDVLSRE